jgi:hypothetical protein
MRRNTCGAGTECPALPAKAACSEMETEDRNMSKYAGAPFLKFFPVPIQAHWRLEAKQGYPPG